MTSEQIAIHSFHTHLSIIEHTLRPLSATWRKPSCGSFISQLLGQDLAISCNIQTLQTLHILAKAAGICNVGLRHSRFSGQKVVATQQDDQDADEVDASFMKCRCLSTLCVCLEEAQQNFDSKHIFTSTHYLFGQPDLEQQKPVVNYSGRLCGCYSVM